jgi:hypothetical protein
MIRLDELIKVESNWRRDWPKSGEFPKFLILSKIPNDNMWLIQKLLKWIR